MLTTIVVTVSVLGLAWSVGQKSNMSNFMDDLYVELRWL